MRARALWLPRHVVTAPYAELLLLFVAVCTQESQVPTQVHLALLLLALLLLALLLLALLLDAVVHLALLAV